MQKLVRSLGVATPRTSLNPPLTFKTVSGQSPWPGAQQRPFQTTVEDELISALPLSTHSAVETLHDSALYKFMIDIDIDIQETRLHLATKKIANQNQRIWFGELQSLGYNMERRQSQANGQK